MCLAHLVWQHEAHAARVPGVWALDAGQLMHLCRAVDMFEEDISSVEWAYASPLVHPNTQAAFSGACIPRTVKTMIRVLRRARCGHQ